MGTGIRSRTKAMQRHHPNINATGPQALRGVSRFVGDHNESPKSTARKRRRDLKRLVVRSAENWEVDYVKNVHTRAERVWWELEWRRDHAGRQRTVHASHVGAPSSEPCCVIR